MVQCRAKSKRTGERCKQGSVPGKDLCRHHGGAKGSGVNWEKPVQVKHARYSKSLPADLAERYEYFKTDPDILSLKPEIATARAFFERFSQQLVEGQGLSAEVGGELRAWLDQIGRITERCDKILNGERYTLRIDQVDLLKRQILDVIERCVSDPAEREAIGREFARLGGKGE